jgi:transcriptional regulator with XRE-family HTH domain
LTRVRHPVTIATMSNDAAKERTVIPEVTLGWRLRIALEAADIKADEMARILDVHRGTITRWTHDIGRPPRRVYLEKWAEITGVSYAWLAGDAAESALAGTPANSQRTRPDTLRYRSPAFAA